MKKKDFIISIIIPTYNRNKEVMELLNNLKNQVDDDTEVIVVDDHSDIPLKEDWFTYIYLEENTGGASIPRNKGLDIAQGKYICFIDSDDNVSPDYIQTIREKIKEEWDYCYMSWKGQRITMIIEDEPPKWNCCVWDCIYKRELIGNIRFREDLKMAEDYWFTQEVRKGKKANITKILYYYNQDSKDSLTKQGVTFNEKYRRKE